MESCNIVLTSVYTAWLSSYRRPADTTALPSQAKKF